MMSLRVELKVVDFFCSLKLIASVVRDSEFVSESANFSPVRPSPNPRIFDGRK